MLKVSISELKTFIGKASQIKENSIVPVTKYIKLTCMGEKTTLTKTNLSSFIVHEIECRRNKDFIIMLDEQAFNAAVLQSEGEEMKITFSAIKGNSKDGMVNTVTMEDGKYIDITFQTISEKEFPTVPDYENYDNYTLTPDMVEAMYIAATHSKDVRGSIMTMENYVHFRNIGKNKCFIVGYDGIILYYKIFDDKLPDMVLEAAACNIIAPYTDSGVILYKGDNYDIFDTGKTLFGFIQTQMKGPDFHKIIELKDDSKSFNIDRKAVIAFCKLAVSINPSALVEPCYFINDDLDKNRLLLDYESTSGTRSNKITPDIKKNKAHKVEKFLFNPNEMITLLKSLSVDTVTFTGPCSHNFYITVEEDKDYTGAIREIVVQAPVTTKTAAG